MPTAMVTGCSRGLGEVFARRLAAGGDDLVLVGRDRARLDELAAALRSEHRIDAEVLVADLAVPDGLSATEGRLRDPGRPVRTLVNAAGSPSGGPMWETGDEEFAEQVAVNVTASARLSHAVLPSMTDAGHGRLVLVSSFAGYLPMPGSGYGPSKAWSLAFADSLARGLEGRDVNVVALCAGRVVTGRNADSGRRGGRLGTWLDAGYVVDTCLRDLARGRSLSVPGLRYRALVAFLELPRRTLRGAGRAARGIRPAA